MQFPAEDPVRAVDSEQAKRDVQGIAGVGAFVINVALIISCWGQWRALSALVGVGLVLTLFNLVVLEWLAKRFSRPQVEAMRMASNGVGVCIVGITAHWPLLAWVFVPYNMLWYFGLDRWVRLRMALYLVAVDGVALATGAEPAPVVAFALIGALGYMVSEKRVFLLRGTLVEVVRQREQLEKVHRQLEKSHQDLEQLHQKALEQERLSSLGLMAASVAHEISNPMSFVTSNVDSMLRDMRGEPNLSETMKEYVNEVLPDTLDGIRRVNSIVSDLRRFSRGGFEIHTPYDFDAEVRAALRIAQLQLGHVQVERELGEVGTVVGHPRQLGQVLVNLLVNAGQATAGGGVVRLTTRREGEEVRVEVRDTGTGMSEETKQRLFQPFFTTKPRGVGIGLGLFVVHDIIKAHGGRIEVESELGKGTCFIIHLPTVPPLPPEPTSAVERRPG